MSINMNVSSVYSRTVPENYKRAEVVEQPKVDEKTITNGNADNNEKLNKTLKYLGVALAAGMALYGGSKAIKYLKNAKAVSTLPTIVKPTTAQTMQQVNKITASITQNIQNSQKLIGNVASATVKPMSAFKGFTAQQIANMYKAGDKTVFKELAKIAHPDKCANVGLNNFFAEVSAMCA